MAIIVDETHNLKSLAIKTMSYESLDWFMSQDKFPDLKAELLKAIQTHLRPTNHHWFSRPPTLASLQHDWSLKSKK